MIVSFVHGAMILIIDARLSSRPIRVLLTTATDVPAVPQVLPRHLTVTLPCLRYSICPPCLRYSICPPCANIAYFQESGLAKWRSLRGWKGGGGGRKGGGLQLALQLR